MHPELTTIRIYSRLLDTCEPARLWHVLRTLDTEGTGRVNFAMDEIATLMSVSTQTIYRWLKQDLGIWWRSRRRIDSQVELYLSGIAKLACALGVDGLGAIAINSLPESCSCLITQFQLNQTPTILKN